ncbi:bifunctional diguanylate cyclase/phosphodiesterase [Fulvimarina endophytica]|uniref:Bifunctional diguanylate cyclase/phosphodiesterase n=2 Tax=Fulvimarina endophytica TaxID=2293836 RepID=A0A371X8D0_9HYPH|nr:bifunctional diguanylate cyclase/phosphodiesterase [Fulvimarina endophytica]
MVGVVYVGSQTINEIVETEVAGRTDNFAHLLVSEPDAVDAFLTGISRNPDVEATIRKIANLSGITRFSIFDRTGDEIYTSRSDRYDWLLRDRPGGMSSKDSLSSSILEKTGNWRVLVPDEEHNISSVLRPLLRNGERIGFLQVKADPTASHAMFTGLLFKAFAYTGLIFLAATGVPILAFLIRRRRIAEADARIAYLASHDSLTQLLNRASMHAETDTLMMTARATRERMGFFFIDLDELGEINASLGQANGDEILKIIAARLAGLCHKDDLVARIGPDDFAVLRRRLGSLNDARAFARRLTNALCEPIERCGEMVKPSISIGCAMVPGDGRSHTELVKHAELAHMRHKSSKQDDLVFFEAWMDEDNHRRRQIEARLRHAIESDGFELYYQPLVCGFDNQVLGYEALIRLRDAEGKPIPPSEFIPIAEARGYIKSIGTFVIQEATRQVAQWPQEIFVSVNLSTVQFVDGDLLNIVADAISAAGIEGKRLELEVVESLLLERSDDVLRQLKALRGLGVKIAMDDFGTGYSSLSYLWRFPFDKLKIDQSFMFAMARGETKVEQLVRTIVSMAHHMGMKVVTEGVEEKVQVDMLRECGCDQIQGYYFGRPVPAEELAIESLRQFRRNHSDPRSGDEEGRQEPASTATARMTGDARPIEGDAGPDLGQDGREDRRASA